MKRTHTCGQLKINDINKEVILQGWVSKIRKMGVLTFVDLRDRYGITQLVFEDNLLKQFDLIKNEYVIEVNGTVIERKSKNLDLITGEIEIKVKTLKIINKSEITPFEIKDKIEANEDTRLIYRYLDLRRSEMQQKIIVRSKINNIIRNFFINKDFVEIETPFFGKSTPEGARDFLIPSRLNTGKFYALPQSPQLYKQLFMISGFDRYFQIVKCFRDEDLRIDRQPEFTQLDMEMSFADSEDVMNVIEEVVKQIIKDIKKIDIKEPIMRMSWAESFDKYGNDKPDLRFGYELTTVDDIFSKTQIPLFMKKKDQVIRAICVDDLLNNKEIKDLTEVANQNSIETLAFLKFNDNEWSGSLASKLNDNEKRDLLLKFQIKKTCTILFIIEEYKKASQALGAIRNHIAKIKNLLCDDDIKLVWIVDFPLFEFSAEENRYVASHHPFTMPSDDCINTFDINKKDAKAKSYDIVLNGFEIGGGSQRVTDSEIQKRIFNTIGLSDDQIKNEFGWFVDAYKYGAPYHSGCALGLDRICMLLAKAENIREVIAFPKNSSGIDPMTSAPTEISDNQLKELKISIK